MIIDLKHENILQSEISFKPNANHMAGSGGNALANRRKTVCTAGGKQRKEMEFKLYSNFIHRHNGNTPANRRKQYVSARREIGQQMKNKPMANQKRSKNPVTLTRFVPHRGHLAPPKHPQAELLRR